MSVLGEDASFHINTPFSEKELKNMIKCPLLSKEQRYACIIYKETPWTVNFVSAHSTEYEANAHRDDLRLTWSFHNDFLHVVKMGDPVDLCCPSVVELSREKQQQLEAQYLNICNKSSRLADRVNNQIQESPKEPEPESKTDSKTKQPEADPVDPLQTQAIDIDGLLDNWKKRKNYLKRLKRLNSCPLKIKEQNFGCIVVHPDIKCAYFLSTHQTEDEANNHAITIRKYWPYNDIHVVAMAKFLPLPPPLDIDSVIYAEPELERLKAGFISNCQGGSIMSARIGPSTSNDTSAVATATLSIDDDKTNKHDL
jgi:hypothetical protein